MPPSHAVRLLFALGVATFLIAISHASAGTVDIWHATQAIAERDVKSRFANVRSIRCGPDRASSTFTRDGVRWWHRYLCAGETFDAIAFELTYVATGECKPCWRMASLTGTDIGLLRQRAPAAPGVGSRGSPPPPPAPPPPAPPPSPASPAPSPPASEPTSLCGASYRNAGRRIRLRQSLDAGGVLLLRDGSVWQPDRGYHDKTALWTRLHTVMLVDGQFGYPCTLVNLNLGERVPARQAVPGSCGGTVYANAGRRVGFAARKEDGATLVLEDDSMWEVSPDELDRTRSWASRPTDVVVLQGNGAYPYICMMVNLDRAELVDVRPAG
jgi:hypothetical protein